MSTDYATVPAEHNWRHLAQQIRELPDGRAAELAGLAEMLVGRLAPGALADLGVAAIIDEETGPGRRDCRYHRARTWRWPR